MEWSDAEVLYATFLLKWDVIQKLMDDYPDSKVFQRDNETLHSIAMGVHTHMLTKSMNARYDKPCTCAGCNKLNEMSRG